MGMLSIALPTVNVYSDGTLVYILYTSYGFHKSCEIWANHSRPSSDKTIEHFEGFDETCLAGITEEQLKYDYHRYWANILMVPFFLNYQMICFQNRKGMFGPSIINVKAEKVIYIQIFHRLQDR